MDQRALGELAERAARLASEGDVAALDDLVARAAAEHRYSRGAIVNLISGEWTRTRTLPMPVLIPRGVHVGRRLDA